MGEIAEMMLDGTLCEGCGEFIGEPVGHPRMCMSCSYDAERLTEEEEDEEEEE